MESVNNTKKLVHIAQMYSPGGGGGAFLLKKVSEYMKLKGYKVTIITSNGFSTVAPDFIKTDNLIDIQSEEIQNNVKIIRLPVQRDYEEWFSSWKECFVENKLNENDIKKLAYYGPLLVDILEVIEKEKPDAITSVAFPALTNIYAWLAAKKLNIPLFYIPCLHLNENWVEVDIIKNILRYADTVFPLSEYEIDYLKNIDIKDEKIKIIGAGVDIESDFLVTKKTKNKNLKTITLLSRKEKYKGFLDVIDAMKDVWVNFPDARLVLAGVDTTFSPTIIEYGKAVLGDLWKKVTWEGYLDEKSKSRLLDETDIFVFPSKSESFGIVILEAWSKKKPVIVSCGSAPSCIIKHGIDGFVIQNTKELSDRIIQLLNDDSLRISLGKNGFQRVLRDFTWDSVSDKYYQTIKEYVG